MKFFEKWHLFLMLSNLFFGLLQSKDTVQHGLIDNFLYILKKFLSYFTFFK